MSSAEPIRTKLLNQPFIPFHPIFNELYQPVLHQVAFFKTAWLNTHSLSTIVSERCSLGNLSMNTPCKAPFFVPQCNTRIVECDNENDVRGQSYTVFCLISLLVCCNVPTDLIAQKNLGSEKCHMIAP